MQIQTNRVYRIAGYKNTINPAWRQKLLALGIIPGALIDVIRVAPMGDPVQIRTRRISLAVRKQDFAEILFEEITA
ncbi:iron transporter [Pantoea rodasii]|uniref:Iron transporter n=1 Tax=Pantoea rodasii TaxID=1076549 RepID=A0A2M9WI44_9GAMM|nr:FeoA domain-containing protein [Pantoea rodasii]ORM60449.1 iron transporter [Pantoea rodasii]PJZ07146.1 iron transporter [Pantoea rodasii]